MDEYQHLRESSDEQAVAAIDGSHAIDALHLIARMLIERRELAATNAQRLRAIQKANEYTYDLQAEQMEGSHAAYSVACSIVAGVCGVSTIEALGADDPVRADDLFDPALPVTDLDAFFRPVGERA